MNKIYVTGPLKGRDEDEYIINKHRLSLACRNILLKGDLPICPILESSGWELDPRLSYDDSWWVNNYLYEFMALCDDMQIIEPENGIICVRLEKEKNLWEVIKC